MSFTDTERVILANQYEILGKLGESTSIPQGNQLIHSSKLLTDYLNENC